MLGAKHNTTPYTTHSNIYRWQGTKVFQKKFQIGCYPWNQTERKMYYSVLQLERYLLKKWTAISEESLKQKLPAHNQAALPVLCCIKVRLCKCLPGECEPVLQMALWDAMTFALRASQEQ